jgi:hypothetical protein
VTLRLIRRDRLLASCGLSPTKVARLLRQTRELGARGGRKPVVLLRAESQVHSLVARAVRS